MPVAIFSAPGRSFIALQNDPAYPEALLRPNPPGEILHEPPAPSVTLTTRPIPHSWLDTALSGGMLELLSKPVQLLAGSAHRRKAG